MPKISEGVVIGDDKPIDVKSHCWCGGQIVGVQPYCSESEYHNPYADGRPKTIDRLYIAGPMSGIESCNYPAFNAAAVQLENAGFEVRNPASYGNVGSHYVDLIREDLRLLLDCHGVAVLDNWWESVGARNEVQVAGLLKMPVRNVDEWVYFSAKNH